jgi:ribonucleoside-diphosphate reductase alpha chain
MQVGPTGVYDTLHAKKYRGPDESFREGCNRQASALADGSHHYELYRHILLNEMYLNAGRIQASIGSVDKTTTAYNCFVSGEIEDSFVSEDGNIMQRAAEAAATMRLGGGIGYDFSTLRPYGSLIKTVKTQTEGPIVFMGIYNAVCEACKSTGDRRGAQMGVLRIDHPDIERFIHVKQKEGVLENFNISVAVTDEFMTCLKNDIPFKLRFNGEVHREVNPRNLWDMLMRSTWDWAEPGVLFIDTINRMNNLYFCEYIAATNPCGEQPLPPFGACLLGSFNLVKFLKWTGTKYEFDWDTFKHVIPIVVQATDNVIDRTIYPLPAQKKEALNKRRMGLGITALANCLEALGFPYATDGFLENEARILEMLRNETYRASINLAKEKGTFPLYRQHDYMDGEFIKTLPGGILHEMEKHGIRNSHLTSIAPTGTISLAHQNVSSGIEPPFDYEYERTIKEFDSSEKIWVEDYGWKVLGVKGRTIKSNQISIDDHLAVLGTAQKYIDSAISKTCNLSANISWNDFQEVYLKAYNLGAKGITTYRPGGKREGILKSKEDKKKEKESGGACTVNPYSGQRECE